MQEQDRLFLGSKDTSITSPHPSRRPGILICNAYLLCIANIDLGEDPLEEYSIPMQRARDAVSKSAEKGYFPSCLVLFVTSVSFPEKGPGSILSLFAGDSFRRGFPLLRGHFVAPPHVQKNGGSAGHGEGNRRIRRAALREPRSLVLAVSGGDGNEHAVVLVVRNAVQDVGAVAEDFRLVFHQIRDTDRRRGDTRECSVVGYRALLRKPKLRVSLDNRINIRANLVLYLFF